MKQTITRLNKVIGQLKAIVKMLETNEDCSKIIIQFQASKAALDSAFCESLSNSLINCIDKKNPDDIKKMLKLIIKLNK